MKNKKFLCVALVCAMIACMFTGFALADEENGYMQEFNLVNPYGFMSSPLQWQYVTSTLNRDYRLIKMEHEQGGSKTTYFFGTDEITCYVDGQLLYTSTLSNGQNNTIEEAVVFAQSEDENYTCVYQFDSNNLLVKCWFKGNERNACTLAYNENQDVISITGRRNANLYSYDDQDRVTGSTRVRISSNDNERVSNDAEMFSVSYTGNKITAKQEQDQFVSTVNDAGLITEQSISTESERSVSDYTYDKNGCITQIVNVLSENSAANTTVTTFTYEYLGKNTDSLITSASAPNRNSSGTQGDGNNQQDDTDQNTVSRTVPATGDSLPLVPLCALLCLAALAIVVLTRKGYVSSKRS